MAEAAATLVPLGYKWPSVNILDCVSKKYCVLLPFVCSDISCLHRLIYIRILHCSLFGVAVKMLQIVNLQGSSYFC